jgi:hypothetical protein
MAQSPARTPGYFPDGGNDGDVLTKTNGDYESNDENTAWRPPAPVIPDNVLTFGFGIQGVVLA